MHRSGLSSEILSDLGEAFLKLVDAGCGILVALMDIEGSDMMAVDWDMEPPEYMFPPLSKCPKSFFESNWERAYRMPKV